MRWRHTTGRGGAVVVLRGRMLFVLFYYKKKRGIGFVNRGIGRYLLLAERETSFLFFNYTIILFIYSFYFLLIFKTLIKIKI